MTRSGLIVQRSLTVHLYATCWNEEKMLPYFFRHYDNLVSRYFIFFDDDLPIGAQFAQDKNFSHGEGGALLINDAQFNQRAEILREKGTDRADFSGARSTSTTGSMPGRAICLRTCWRSSRADSWNTATRFSRCGVRFEKTTRAN
jgi:hypothetical protein